MRVLWPRFLCALAAVLAIGLFIAPISANAKASSIRLAQITPWVTLGGELTVAFDTSLADSDTEGNAETTADTSATIRISVHQAVQTRSGFEVSFDKRGLGKKIYTETLKPAELPIAFQVGQGDTGRKVIPVSKQGIYPLVAELLDNNKPVASLVTHVIVAATPTRGEVTGEPLRTSMIWHFQHPPSPNPKNYRSHDTDAFTADGALGRMALALPNVTEAPITLGLSPETLERWKAATKNEEVSRSLTALKDSQQPLIGEPYTPVSFSGLVSNRREDLVSDLLTLGSEATDSVLGTRPQSAIVDPQGISPSSLEALRDVGVDRLILQQDQVQAPEDDKFTVSAPFSVRIGNRHFDAMESDSSLVDLSQSQGTGAARAQALNAGMALTALEQPNALRGIVLDMPTDWAPSATELESITHTLSKSPFVVPVDVESLMSEVPPGADDADREIVTQDIPLPVPPEELDRTSRQLSGLTEILSPLAPEVTASKTYLALAISTYWSSEQSAHQDYLDAARSEITDFTKKVALPTDRTINMTAKLGRIPITVLNNSNTPIDVVLELRGEGIAFPQGRTHALTLKPGSTTKDIPVEIQRAGMSDLAVSLTSPNGQLSIGSSRVALRSSAPSGAGIALATTAGVFLALWWLLSARNRHKRPPLTVAKIRKETA